MHLALSLSPLLATASKLLGKEAAWIYFTGKDNFIYLYPWVPSSQFRFSPLIYNTAYWQEAITQLSPSEHAILSRPYQDLAGQGRMVTLSQPITQTGEITGLSTKPAPKPTARQAAPRMPIALPFISPPMLTQPARHARMVRGTAACFPTRT